MAQQHPTLSIVIPSYNESANVAVFYAQLTKEIAKDKKLTYELVYVNDGSRDDTQTELEKLAQKDPRVRLISFSRNFGKEIATTAGINHAQGDATVIMDADGQHPPELIHEFLKKWREGAHVVIGVRKKNQKEGLINRWGSQFFYAVINASADVKLIPKSTDFRLIDKIVRQEFNKFTERSRITRGLVDWVGYKKATVEFIANERMAGEATYSFLKRAKLGMNSFVSLSLAPLHLLIYVGIAITLLFGVIGMFVLIEQFLLGDPLGIDMTGTAMLGVLIIFLVGLLFISQGLVALYISHIHTEAQNRPLYIIDRSRSTGL